MNLAEISNLGSSGKTKHFKESVAPLTNCIFKNMLIARGVSRLLYVCLFRCLFTCLFVCLFVCLFFFLFLACIFFGNVAWMILDERVYLSKLLPSLETYILQIWQFLRILSYRKKILLLNQDSLYSGLLLSNPQAF